MTHYRKRAWDASSPMSVDVDVGSHVMVDGVKAAVRMVTATQVLVHVEGAAAEEWVPNASGRLRLLQVDDPAVEAAGDESLVCVDQAEQTGEQAGASSEEEDDQCCICHTGGKLTCCDVCPRVYHLRCLPAADVAALKQQSSLDTDWWCPHCKRLLCLTFNVYRICSTAASDDVAQQLFEYMSDEQHDDAWDTLRESSSALAVMLPRHSWIRREPAFREQDNAAEQAALQLQTPVQSSWWRAYRAGSNGKRASLGCATLEGRASHLSHANVECRSPGTPDGLSDEGNADGNGNENHGSEGGLGNGRSRTSEFRGVSRRYGKWKARIKQNGHDFVIGDFDDEISAARAYDEKARELHGSRAMLNFN